MLALSLCGLLLGGTIMCNNVEAGQKDNFYWLGQINKATDIINTSENLLTPEQGHKFAQVIQKVLDDGDKPGAAHPNLVITFEPLLIAAGGPEVTMLHVGRSSQDMLTTIGFVQQRDELLALSQALNSMQQTLLALAEQHQETIIPNYTNGVAAQPNSLAHFLLGYAAAFARDQERLQQCYARLNRSPMGATVLNGTGWPLNRDRMAAYLGFDGLAYNTYDAGQIYPNEAAMEVGGMTNAIAIHLTSFIEEIMQQYSQPRPWILLKEGQGNTYVSSAMPQKRNPGILNRVRGNCGTILGLSTQAAFRVHNIPPGMADGRFRGSDKMVSTTTKAIKDFDHILQNLDIRPERALEELNLDWTCSQEIADVMMRKYNIPFRTGHHFASEVVTYARTNNVPPSDFTYAQAQEVYKQLAAADAALPAAFPMTEADWRAALNPVAIVHNRAVKGGPQTAELKLMLQQERTKLETNVNWQKKASQKIKAAETKLNNDFAALLNQQ